MDQYLSVVEVCGEMPATQPQGTVVSPESLFSAIITFAPGQGEVMVLDKGLGLIHSQ